MPVSLMVSECNHCGECMLEDEDFRDCQYRYAYWYRDPSPDSPHCLNITRAKVWKLAHSSDPQAYKWRHWLDKADREARLFTIHGSNNR